MRFNFQIILTWSVLFIVWYYPSQIVEGTQSRSTRSEITKAVECLDQVIKHNRAPPLSTIRYGYGRYGDYIDEFCKDKNVSNVVEKMENCTEIRESVGAKLKKCLYDSNCNEIFDNYFTFGQMEIDKWNNPSDNTLKDAVDTTNDNQEAAQTFTHKKQALVLKDYETNVTSHTLPSLLPEENIEQDDQSSSPSKNQGNSTSAHNARKEEILKISKFVLGMCYRDKPVKLDELEEETQKQDTIQCLGRCETVFFLRTKNDIDRGKHSMSEFLQQKEIVINYEKKEIYKYDSPELYRLLEEKKRTEDLYYKLRPEFIRGEMPQNLQTMKKIVKNFSEMYSNISEFISYIHRKYGLATVSQDYTKPTEILIQKILDEELSISFRMYKNCAERECGIIKSSLPSYDYIRDQATKMDNKGIELATTSGLASTDKEAKIAEINVQPGTTLNQEKNIDPKFFQVLLSKDEDDKDVDISNSSHAEKQ